MLLFSFPVILAHMEKPSATTISEIEAMLQKKFVKNDADRTRLPSTAGAPRVSGHVSDIVLPDIERPKMPVTKSKYLVKENPHEVTWEREVRKFLRKLTPRHEHRVSAAMVYEWATGIKTADLVAEGGSTADLKRINRILKFYFGDPYMTWICGRKVPKAYKVRAGYYIRYHRPMTLTLWAEYTEGTLYP